MYSLLKITLVKGLIITGSLYFISEIKAKLNLTKLRKSKMSSYTNLFLLFFYDNIKIWKLNIANK